jgi:molecular chaperone GrpE
MQRDGDDDEFVVGKEEEENKRGQEMAEDDMEDADEQASVKVVKLRKELEATRKEKQENLDGWQRAKADYVNALRRFDEEKKNSRQRGVQEAVEALLPAFDALERAKEHGDIPEGFTGIVKQLEAAFSSLGLTPIGVVGEVFDPAIHEAFGQDAVDSDVMDDTVTAVLEKGWRQGDHVIRAAKVRVGIFGTS